MHSLSNNFVMIPKSELSNDFTFSPGNIKYLANAKAGIGFDQLLLFDYPTKDFSKINLKIWNADGSAASLCINGLKCLCFYNYLNYDITTSYVSIGDNCYIATWDAETQKARVTLATQKILMSDLDENSSFRLKLALKDNLCCIPDKDNIIALPKFIHLGNKHIVCFVKDLSAISLYSFIKIITNAIECNEFAYNISIVEIISDDILNMRVWERGVGETSACGSAAFAVFHAAKHYGFIYGGDDKYRTSICFLNKGKAILEYDHNSQVYYQSNEVHQVFRGELLL